MHRWTRQRPLSGSPWECERPPVLRRAGLAARRRREARRQADRVCPSRSPVSCGPRIERRGRQMMHTARCGDVTISYEDSGAGEPALLLLPGWCASRAVFRELASRQPAARTLAMDWRGHGGSGSTDDDFGSAELVADALAVIAASGAHRIVPVATAHAGWVAIELRCRLGERVSKLVLVDWIVTDPPPPFLGALSAMQDSTKALQVRDQLFAMWTEGVEHPEVLRFVREDMGSYTAAMWSRAAREIAAVVLERGQPATRPCGTRAPTAGTASLWPARRCRVPRRAGVVRRRTPLVRRPQARGSLAFPHHRSARASARLNRTLRRDKRGPPMRPTFRDTA